MERQDVSSGLAWNKACKNAIFKLKKRGILYTKFTIFFEQIENILWFIKVFHL